MDILNISKIAQIIITFLLVILILIQSKGKGLVSGIGSSLGTYRSLRGLERVVFILTIIFGVLLVINSLIIVILS